MRRKDPFWFGLEMEPLGGLCLRLLACVGVKRLKGCMWAVNSSLYVCTELDREWVWVNAHQRERISPYLSRNVCNTNGPLCSRFGVHEQ